MTFPGGPPVAPGGGLLTPDAPAPALTSRVAELGRPANMELVYSTRGERQWQPKFADPNPALRFPESVKVYNVMLRTDDQVDSIMRAVTLPIQDAPWDLDQEGVADNVAEFVRTEIGLPEPGSALPNRRRGQAGIVFSEHLREALDCLAYGFMPFEQCYESTFPGDPGHPEQEPFTRQPAVHLRKLGPRHASTIRRIRLAQDGGLVSIIQSPPQGEPDWFNRPDGEPGVEIPVDRLVFYTNDRKGADWTGVSILRTAYRPWKIKEQLCRLDAIAAERNSLGMPVVHYDPTIMDEAAALELARAYRSGAEAGIAMPPGASIEIIGVSGTVPDLTPKIEAYNQAIGRASLAMFLNLGHDNGARSLGDTFLAFFTRSLQTIATQIAQTFTEHVIRDLVELNFGPEEPYPRLTPGEITTEMALAPDAMKLLVEAKVIVPDDPLEENIRRRYRLPPADPDTGRAAAPAGPAAVPGASPEPAVPGAPNPANPFLPADLPADTPPAPPPGPGDVPAAAADEPPDDGLVHVPAHTRRHPNRPDPTLAGYAAFLASQVAVPTPAIAGWVRGLNE